MTTVSSNTTPIQVMLVGTQGPAGPQGPEGPGFPSRWGNVYDLAPIASEIPLISSAPYAYTIQGLKGLKLNSGTLTLSIQINGVDIGGLSLLSASATPQDVVATALNSLAVGDRMTLVIANPLGAAGLEFTMY
jgi:hypothetical protein